MAAVMTAADEWRENLNIHIICPNCQETPPNLVEDFAAGDTVCGSCGLVLGDRIVDTRSEWRTFANDESGGDDPSRVGKAANPLDEGVQLETSIAFGGDRSARELTRAHAKLTAEKGRKNFSEAFQRMTTIAESLRLDQNTLEFAKHVYRLSAHDPKFKAKNTDAVIAGCIFISCRQTGTARTFREINNVTRVSKKEIGKTFKMLEGYMRERKIQEKAGTAVGPNIPGVGDGYQDDKTSATAMDYVHRFCSRLAMTPDAIACSKSIAERVSRVGSLAGKSPLSIAAACIYLASHLLNDAKTPRDIAKVAGVSESTIRSSYKLLVPAKEALIDPKWLTKPNADVSRLPAA